MAKVRLVDCRPCTSMRIRESRVKDIALHCVYYYILFFYPYFTFRGLESIVDSNSNLYQVVGRIDARRSFLEIGSCLIRIPVASKMALVTAGAMSGVLGSPAPPGGFPELMI